MIIIINKSIVEYFKGLDNYRLKVYIKGLIRPKV